MAKNKDSFNHPIISGGRTLSNMINPSKGGGGSGSKHRRRTWWQAFQGSYVRKYNAKVYKSKAHLTGEYGDDYPPELVEILKFNFKEE